jgi:hypothetical protein
MIIPVDFGEEIEWKGESREQREENGEQKAGN